VLRFVANAEPEIVTVLALPALKLTAATVSHHSSVAKSILITDPGAGAFDIGQSESLILTSESSLGGGRRRANGELLVLFQIEYRVVNRFEPSHWVARIGFALMGVDANLQRCAGCRQVVRREVLKPDGLARADIHRCTQLRRRAEHCLIDRVNRQKQNRSLALERETEEGPREPNPSRQADRVGSNNLRRDWPDSSGD